MPYNSPIQNNVEYLKVGEIVLALHSWIPSEVKAVLFFIHGIQSHAGWLFETGPQLALNSIAVYVLDRRGSGLSQGLQGDIPSVEVLFKDYALALKKIKQDYPEVPLTLLGHSLGGSLLIGLLTSEVFDISYDAVVLCASALGKMHYNLSLEELKVVLENTTIELQDINISNNAYTNDINFLDFIKNDKYCCRKITARTKSVLLEIEKLYWQKEGIIKDVPSAYVCPKSDPLVNIDSALNTFMSVSNGRGIVLQLPTNKHYLWFTNQRHILINWLANYILTKGYQKSCY